MYVTPSHFKRFLPNLDCVPVWEVPQFRNTRLIWNQAYKSRVQGVVLVIDASDHDRLPEAQKELMDVLGDEAMKGVPCLILANKQDRPHALGVNDLAERLNLRDIRGRPWHIKVRAQSHLCVLLLTIFCLYLVIPGLLR